MTFYLVGKETQYRDFVCFWIYFLGSPQQVKNYAYTLSITGKTGDKFTYYGHVKPLDEGCNDIIAKSAVFVIGTGIIPSLRNENEELPIEVTIHALKEEAKDDETESGVSADESE